MKNLVVAPDTGVLLAVGYGEGIDPKAPAAIRAMSDLKRSDARLILLSTVDWELETKLNEISEVYPALRMAARLLESREAPLNLADLQELMVRVKRDSPERIGRYIEAFEGQAADLIQSQPSADPQWIVPQLLNMALALETSVRSRIDALKLERFDAQETPDPPDVSGVRGGDMSNVRAAEQLGQSRDCAVLFLVFESGLHSRREEIRGRYAHVDVTTPLYLSSYLADQ